MQVGTRFAGPGIGLHPQDVLGTCADLVPDIGLEDQVLALPVYPDGDEGGVLDSDPHLLHRRYQVEAVGILPQDRGEQAHQGFAADRGAFMEPLSVALDDNVDFAAMGRIPEVHRWEAPPGRLPRSGGDSLQAGRWLSLGHEPKVGPSAAGLNLAWECALRSVRPAPGLQAGRKRPAPGHGADPPGPAGVRPGSQ